jgi:hypothetical protein
MELQKKFFFQIDFLIFCIYDPYNSLNNNPKCTNFEKDTLPLRSSAESAGDCFPLIAQIYADYDV